MEEKVGVEDEEDLRFRVYGMTCASCAARVEKAISRVPGVKQANVNFAAGEVSVMPGTSVHADQLEVAVRRAGYRLQTLPDGDQVDEHAGDAAKLRRKVAVCGALT